MLRSVISPLILFFWRFEYFFRSISILSQLKFKKCEKERIEKNCEILYNFNNDITFFSFLLFPREKKIESNFENEKDSE